MTASTLTDRDFKVADLSLAGFGRKEISLAEHEMPGLMAIRKEYAEAQPERPDDVPAPDWLRWEQERHSKLLLDAGRPLTLATTETT